MHRSVAGCAAILLLAAGCGSTLAAGDGATTVAPPDAALGAPPIQAVDRPAGGLWSPPDARDTEGASSTIEVCQVAIATSGSGDGGAAGQMHGEQNCPKPTPEEEAAGQAAQQRYRNAVRPADGASPRTIAEVTRPGSGRLELAAWANAQGELCLGASSLDQTGTGGESGPFGPCIPESECEGALCFQELARDSPPDYALIGVVPADADLVTITVAGGEVRTYPLTGPLVPGFPSRRVFMAGLGPTSYKRLVVSERGVTVARSEKSATSIAFEQCSDQLRPDAMAEEMQAESERLLTCMRAATRTAAPAGG